MNVEAFANQVLDRCESTNDLAKRMGEAGLPHGTWVSARIQEKGRGRLGREWRSLEGNLFLSVVLRVAEPSLWSWIPLMTAVAIHRAIREEVPGCEPKIKWPNDLWIEGAKVGGILCEGFGNRSGSFIVVGIGLNCAAAPQDIDQKAQSLAAYSTQPDGLVDRIRPRIVSGLLDEVNRLSREGSGTLMNYYESHAAFPPGTPVEWGTGKTAKVVGLGSSGELRVVYEDGSFEQLYAEDVKVRSVPAAGGGSPA